MHQDLCRRSFRHVRFGKGRIIAHCGDTLLVEYPGKRLQLAPLWELYAQRAPVTISEPVTPSGTPAAPTGEESICVGSSVTHRVFGTGVVLGICQGIAQVRFDSDGQTKQIMLGVTGEESICVGSSVTHRVFGTGVVLGICQGIAQVRFDSDGQTKQIMLGVTLRSGILQCNG